MNNKYMSDLLVANFYENNWRENERNKLQIE